MPPSTTPSQQPSRWRNLDSAFPMFVSGAAVKSVYERAGFDVKKSGNKPSTHLESTRSSNKSQALYRPSSRSSSTSSNSSGRPSQSHSVRTPSTIPEVRDNAANTSQSNIISQKTISSFGSDLQQTDVKSAHLAPLAGISQPLNDETLTISNTILETPNAHDRPNSEGSSVYSTDNDPTHNTIAPNLSKPTLVSYQGGEAQMRSLEETLASAQYPTTLDPGATIASSIAQKKTAAQSLMLNTQPPNQPIVQYQPPSPRPLDLSPTSTKPPPFPNLNLGEQLARATTPNSENWQHHQQHHDQGYHQPASSTAPGIVSRSESSASSRDPNSPTTPADHTTLTPLTPFLDDGFQSEALKKSHNTRTMKRRAKKGPCKGCNLAIVGKSVSSRDGTLSGRWHRECFNCAECGTCNFQKGAPTSTLPTATTKTEFYIFNDNPLCHKCYHAQNNSICPTCQLGIEGECLDDGFSRYHLACLTCGDCGVLLDAQAGYLSVVNGVFYCLQHVESHAHHLMSSSGAAKSNETLSGKKSLEELNSGPTPLVEKRRTQLLMM